MEVIASERLARDMDRVFLGYHNLSVAHVVARAENKIGDELINNFAEGRNAYTEFYENNRPNEFVSEESCALANTVAGAASWLVCWSDLDMWKATAMFDAMLQTPYAANFEAASGKKAPEYVSITEQKPPGSLKLPSATDVVLPTIPGVDLSGLGSIGKEIAKALGLQLERAQETGSRIATVGLVIAGLLALRELKRG